MTALTSITVKWYKHAQIHNTKSLTLRFTCHVLLGCQKIYFHSWSRPNVKTVNDSISRRKAVQKWILATGTKKKKNCLVNKHGAALMTVYNMEHARAHL